jgi:hypothetical protein
MKTHVTAGPKQSNLIFNPGIRDEAGNISFNAIRLLLSLPGDVVDGVSVEKGTFTRNIDFLIY